MLEIKMACTTDAEGNAACENAEDGSEPSTQMPKTGGGGWDAEGQGDIGQSAITDPQPPTK